MYKKIFLNNIYVNDKTNIKDNIQTTMKQYNNSLIKSYTKIWKIKYDDINLISCEKLTPCKINFIVQKISNEVNIFINTFNIGYGNFKKYVDEFHEKDDINNVSFELCNINEQNNLFKLSKQFCPLNNIYITSESNVINGMYIEESPIYSLTIPASVTLSIDTEGYIKIYDCSFLLTTNNNFYGNSIDINYFN